MKIVIIQEAGRHSENREFREGLSWQRALQSYGHDVILWGLGYDNYSVPFGDISKGADVIFLLEQYDQTGWTPDFSKSKALKIHISIDDHCNINEHFRQVERQQIDIHFSATERYLEYYNRPGMEKHWLPNCYDDLLIYPMSDIQKSTPIGFCGNLVNRKPWIDYLAEHHGMKTDIFIIGKNMVQAINAYQIGFNRNMDIDINYRTFEVTGCRTMLLTNATPNLEKMFDIGKEIVTYDSLSGLSDKIRYFMNHPAERESIAEAGYQRVKRDHTYTARAGQLLEILNAH